MGVRLFEGWASSSSLGEKISGLEFLGCRAGSGRLNTLRGGVGPQSPPREREREKSSDVSGVGVSASSFPLWSLQNYTKTPNGPNFYSNYQGPYIGPTLLAAPSQLRLHRLLPQVGVLGFRVWGLGFRVKWEPPI